MEFQMRVRLRVRNCQNEFSSGRASLRIIRGPPTTKATRRASGSEASRREDKERRRKGEAERERKGEEEAGSRGAAQRSRRAQNKATKKCPARPTTAAAVCGYRKCQSSAKKRTPFRLLRSFVHLLRAFVPLVLSVIARPSRFFSRRLEREDLLCNTRVDSRIYIQMNRAGRASIYRRPIGAPRKQAVARRRVQSKS